MMKNRPDLCFGHKMCGFCIPETMPVFKNEQPFVTGSVFHERIWDLAMRNSILEQDKEERSFGHFLASIIHEIMHSVYKRFIPF